MIRNFVLIVAFMLFVNTVDAYNFHLINIQSDFLITQVENKSQNSSNIKIEQSSLDFGTCPVSSNNFLNIEVTNLGNDTLKVNSVQNPKVVSVFGKSTLSPKIEVSKLNFLKTLDAGNSDRDTLMVYNLGDENLLVDFDIELSDNTTPSLIDFQTSLDCLSDSYQDITNLIPNIYEFTEGEEGSSIQDGGNNMYDDGNYMFIDFNPLPYTNNTVSSTSYVQPYFTAKFPGLFIASIGLRNNPYFIIKGMLGTRNGLVDFAEITTTFNKKTYSGYIKRVFDTTSNIPSVNHLIIIESDPNAIASVHQDPFYDFHSINNIQNVKRVHYILFATKDGGYVSNEIMQQIMMTYLGSPCNSNGWIGLSKLNLNIEPGSNEQVDISYYTKKLNEGVYEATILAKTNDPTQPELRIPISLDLKGKPSINLSKEAMNFRKTYINKEYTQKIVIENRGTAPLYISSIAFSSHNFFTKDSLSPIEPKKSRVLNVNFESTSQGIFNEKMTIYSNDSSKSIIDINLFSQTVEPPKIEIEYENQTFSLQRTETMFAKIKIKNTEGADTLIYSFRIDYDSINNGKHAHSVGKKAEEHSTNVISISEVFSEPSNFLGYIEGLSELYFSGIYKLENHFYFIDTNSEYELLKYSIEEKKIVDRYDLPDFSYYNLTWDGKLLWTCSGEGVAYGLNLEGEVVKSFKLPQSGSASLTFNRDHFLYVSSFDNSTIYKLDVDGSIIDNFTPNSQLEIWNIQAPRSDNRVFANQNGKVVEVVFSGLSYYTKPTIFENYISFYYFIEANHLYTQSSYFSERIGIYETGLNTTLLKYPKIGNSLILKGGSEEIELIIEPKNEAVGLHELNLWIESNDPVNPDVKIPFYIEIINIPPTVINPLPDSYIELHQYTQDNFYINLKNIFEDLDKHDLTYQISFDREDKVLVYNFDERIEVKPLSGGKVNFIIDAMDGFGGIASDTFSIFINDINNNPPTQKESFVKESVELNNDSLFIKLSEYFLDYDGHQLFYSGYSEFGLLDIGINGDTLIAKPFEIGEDQIRIRIFDDFGGELFAVLKVNVVERILGVDNQNKKINLSVYPNPVEDWIEIQGNKTDLMLKIFSLSGVEMYSKTNLKDDSISLEIFPKGLYTFNFYDKSGKLIKTFKIIKN